MYNQFLSCRLKLFANLVRYNHDYGVARGWHSFLYINTTNNCEIKADYIYFLKRLMFLTE